MRIYTYNEFLNNFTANKLDFIYLIKTSGMAYTGTIRSVSKTEIIMDLPLKFYINNNPMHTPSIINKDEINEIKEVPLSGNIEIMTKKEGIKNGKIQEIFDNRITIKNNELITVYFQDFDDIT